MWSRDTRSSPGLKQSGTDFFSDFLFGYHNYDFQTKEKRYLLSASCYQDSIKMLTHGMGCRITYWNRSFHIWKVTISAEKYIQVLEQHIQMMSFLMELFAYFSKTMLNHISHLLQHHGFIEESGCLTALPTVQNLSPTENIWYIIKQDLQQRRPKTVEQLEFYIRQKNKNKKQTKFSPKCPVTGLLSSQMFLHCWCWANAAQRWTWPCFNF